jgi:hypothetical protein
MTDPKTDSGWSQKRRRDACIQLAKKLDDAVGAASGVVNEPGQIVSVGRQTQPRRARR